MTVRAEQILDRYRRTRYELPRHVTGVKDVTYLRVVDAADEGGDECVGVQIQVTYSPQECIPSL